MSIWLHTVVLERQNELHVFKRYKKHSFKWLNLSQRSGIIYSQQNYWHPFKDDLPESNPHDQANGQAS